MFLNYIYNFRTISTKMQFFIILHWKKPVNCVTEIIMVIMFNLMKFLFEKNQGINYEVLRYKIKP